VCRLTCRAEPYRAKSNATRKVNGRQEFHTGVSVLESMTLPRSFNDLTAVGGTIEGCTSALFVAQYLVQFLNGKFVVTIRL